MTMNYTVDQLMLLDKSSKDDCEVLCRYGRAPSEQEAIHHVSLNRGVRYSILLALSFNGYMAEGSIDGVELHDFVVNGVASLFCTFYTRNANEHCTFDRLELRVQVPWTNLSESEALKLLFWSDLELSLAPSLLSWSETSSSSL